MAAKRRTCTKCGETHPLTEKWWYLYEGRTPIYKKCELARSSAGHKASRAAKGGAK